MIRPPGQDAGVSGSRMLSWTLAFFLPALVSAEPPVHGLDGGRIGVYGTDFEFTTLSVLKAGIETSKDPSRLRRYADRLRRNHEKGRFNLFGLYVADRVKYERPLDDCLRAADAILAGVGRRNVDAVFLSEENVPSRRGLAILNGLYDGLKQRWPDLPVFQWLSAPLGPVPDLKADGWVYDFYGRRRLEFRRMAVRYLVTGKPLVMCLNASPMVARFDDVRGGAVTREQWAVCNEFDIPVFFFCVDSKWGNPDIWRISRDADIRAWREWLLDAVDRVRHAPPRSDVLSAEYVDGADVEAAPDAEGRFRFEERFASPSFLDRWSVRGFRNIVWRAGNGGSVVFRPRSRVFRGLELYSHIVSEFEMRDPVVRLRLARDAGSAAPRVVLLLSATGHDWPGRGVPIRSSPGVLQVDARGNERFRSREYWIQVRVAGRTADGKRGSVAIRDVRFECRVAPPDAPGVVLHPGRDGVVRYEDRFGSRKCFWVARVEHPGALEWKPGRLSVRGIKGRVNRAVLVWPFSCGKPLRDIRAAADVRANPKNLGGMVRLAISADGRTWTSAVDAGRFPEGAGGWRSGTLRIDTSQRPDFRDVSRFFVRLELADTCGLDTPPAAIVTRIEVRARTASPRR